MGDRIETRVFDLAADEPLPRADMLVCSDLLYSRELSMHVARHCREALWGAAGAHDDEAATRLLLTSSQQFAWIKDAFLDALNSPPASPQHPRWRELAWSEARLESFTGSGILVEDDQVYDANIRWLDVVA